MILFRPVGRKELDLIIESGMTKFPPRLPEQPIFYPVLNENYAIRVGSWNTDGYIVKFELNSDYAVKWEVHCVGDKECLELWIPAEELENFNNNIVGKIELLE
jgi:hypothetical protein